MIDWGMLMHPTARIIYDVVYFVVVSTMIIKVIMNNRNPVKTIAWILVLTFLPILGILFYILFGRNQRRERIINKKSLNSLLKKPRAEYLAQTTVKVNDEERRLSEFFKSANQAFPYEGNKIDIFTDGYSMMGALIRALSKAEKHIHLEFYIFEDDPIGRLIRDVLIDKAKQGVEVRVIYDDVGCWSVPNAFFDEMLKSGIEVRSFLKVRYPRFTSRVNYRNHRKIVVIDGELGFIGGMNIANRYLKGVSWGVWRDTHLQIRGKAVHGLQTVFLVDWYFVERTLITSSHYFPKLGNYGEATAQVVTSEPVGPWCEIMQGLVMAISKSRKYFYMQTPYFLPTETILEALQTAALAGVDIRLMLPLRGDNRITQAASCSYIGDLLRAGVKVYFYRKGFLHSKLMVSDDTLSTVGSTNLDFRSFEQNFEVNAFMYDKETALRMKEIFLSDQKECSRVYLKHWKQRHWTYKVSEAVLKLLAPLL